MKFTLAFLLLAGCVDVAPNLKIPEAQCSKMDMPPIPQKATLTIDGDKIIADEGGENLLRN